MKLSIIVAVYNTSKYLNQCLDSVLNQTLPREDYEVIIVNDKSTDNSLDIIKEITAGHENVRIIDKAKNEATFWSRVDGIMAAQGDYVGFVDSDDWIEKDMYANMLKKAEESGADIVECGTIYEYDNGTTGPMRDRTYSIYSPEELLSKYSTTKIQLAMYLRIFSKKVLDVFRNDMHSYFDANRQDYCGIRNEDDLLYPLLVGNCNKLCYIEEYYCHHRAEVPGSTMDILRTNPKREVDAWIYRVGAGFDVMHFIKNKPKLLPYIEHKQINIIFTLLGRFLESDIYSKEEQKKIMKNAVSRFAKESGRLSFKDMLRFMHLRLKVIYCYGL